MVRMTRQDIFLQPYLCIHSPTSPLDGGAAIVLLPRFSAAVELVWLPRSAAAVALLTWPAGLNPRQSLPWGRGLHRSGEGPTVEWRRQSG